MPKVYTLQEIRDRYDALEKKLTDEAEAKEVNELSKRHREFCERSQMMDWYKNLSTEKMKALKKAYDISSKRKPATK